MKKAKIVSILCAGLFTLYPTGHAFMSPLETKTGKSTTKVAAKAADSTVTASVKTTKPTTATAVQNTKPTPTTASEKTDTKKAEEKVIPPAENQASWTPAGANSKLLTYYDANSLKYDKDSGIITAWTKWVYKAGTPTGVKTVLLLSHYDVRVKVFADLYYINYSGLGTVLKEGPAADQSWVTISVNTLGEDMRIALNNYLISH